MTVSEYIESLYKLIEALQTVDQNEPITPYINDDLTVAYIVGDYELDYMN